MSEEASKVKRVTVNFNKLRTYGQDSIEEFNKWKNEMIEQGAKVIFDRRNNIYCMAPTMDYEMYYNYVTYLNSYRDDWMNAGYFDAGMVPYIMWPSFMDASPVMEQMRNVTRTIGINLVPVPSVALLKPSYISNGQDYWIFREDLFKLMKIMEQTNSVYKFDISSPDDATLSKFLKPLAALSASGRGGTPR